MTNLLFLPRFNPQGVEGGKLTRQYDHDHMISHALDLVAKAKNCIMLEGDVKDAVTRPTLATPSASV